VPSFYLLIAVVIAVTSLFCAPKNIPNYPINSLGKINIFELLYAL